MTQASCNNKTPKSSKNTPCLEADNNAAILQNQFSRPAVTPQILPSTSTPRVMPPVAAASQSSMVNHQTAAPTLFSQNPSQLTYKSTSNSPQVMPYIYNKDVSFMIFIRSLTKNSQRKKH